MEHILGSNVYRYKPARTYAQQKSSSCGVQQQQYVLLLCRCRQVSLPCGMQRVSGHFFPFSLFILRGSGTVCNIRPETATEQSILEIASRSSESQQQQQSFQPSLHRPEVGSERHMDANS